MRRILVLFSVGNWHVLALLWLAMLVQPVLAQDTSPRFVKSIPWAQSGAWLKIDTHIHTKFSDGGSSIERIADMAQQYGCDAIAITDHSDPKLSAATEGYAQAIREAREAHPQLLIISGLEWNVPPHGGREHATVLFPSNSVEWNELFFFKSRFDGMLANRTNESGATEGLQWLAQRYQGQTVQPVLMYNHPCRNRSSLASFHEEFRQLARVNRMFIGFSGAPGHQEMPDHGGYAAPLFTIDRWDPATAEIGGTWDQLLREGHDVWAARSPSDFHNANPNKRDDYWPGQFSETWVFAPERSAEGVLSALREGSGFAAHGHIAREVMLSINAQGLERAAICGESVSLSAETPISISLRLNVPAQDWSEAENFIDEIEFILIGKERIENHTWIPSRRGNMTATIPWKVPPGGAVVRARGRRIIEDQPDLLFYTNPIRIVDSRN